MVAANAVDGSNTTRYSSLQADNQTWQVDLGANYLVTQVDVDWEAAYASRYRIMTSLDGTAWTQASVDITGTTGAGLKSVTFAAVNARYVKLELVTRATIYGFSFWTVSVYGDSAPTGVGLSWAYGVETTDTDAAPVLYQDITVSSAQAHVGARSYAIGNAALKAYAENISSVALGTPLWMRMAFRMTAAPGGTTRILEVLSGGTDIPVTARLHADRTVRMYDRLGNFAGPASAALVADGSWHQVELLCKVNSVDLGEAALWVNNVEIQAPAPFDVGNSAIAKRRYGKDSDLASTGMFIDSLAESTVGRIGVVGGSADTTAPNTTITVAPDVSTTDRTATFEFTANEVGCTFQYQLDGGAYTACSSPLTFAGPLSVAAHTINIRATDPAGNVDASPATFSWTITASATQPNTTFTETPSDPSPSLTGTFEWEVDIASTFQRRLDGGAWAAASSPYPVTVAAAGSHTFEVRATSLAGVLETTPASYTWQVATALSLGLTDFGEIEMLKHLLRTRTMYVALFVSTPTDAAAGNEPVGAAYARVATPVATWAVPTTAGCVNVAAVNFANPTGVYTPVAWGLYDQLTGGNLWFSALIRNPSPTAAGQPLGFAAGDLQIQAF